MKKIAPVIAAIVVVGAVLLYFFVFSDTGDKVKPAVRVEYSPGDYFTTNVRSVDGSAAVHLLKATIVLVVNEEGLEDMLTKENARIRDTIIFILRALTQQEILASGTQDQLREKIISALNERLGIDNFIEVLFNDFVMA